MRILVQLYDDLVDKINIDLENIRKWMLKSKLQIHPSKSKYMIIGSSYNLKNKAFDNSMLVPALVR